ncbi:hypothetical protein AAF712_010320 [Marasmius tenuissimus]|uniref:Uncharacterized protein n=1 Tax=Marasmius tenuissimus TaxID=585030 RepID=A0ABR2ZNP1_9AGAR|nr:hypothetical protein PM082_007626 [Marasmius tenuissimus]
MRRRRLAKLSRTFGENIPPELVASGDRYPGFDVTLDETNQYNEDRSSWKEKESTESHESFYIVEKPTFDVKARSKSCRLSGLSSIGSLPPESPPPPYTTLGRSASLMVSSTRSRSKHNYALSETHFGKDDGVDLAFEQLNNHQDPHARHSKSELTHRRQKGWSGEWNRDDMEQVVKKLRMLK